MPSEIEECYELSDESFDALIDAIIAIGFDEETASDMAAKIGDTPVIDEDGKIVVTDREGQEIKLALDFFD